MPDSSFLSRKVEAVISMRVRPDATTEADRAVFLIGLKLQNLALDRLRAALAREDSIVLKDVRPDAG